MKLCSFRALRKCSTKSNIKLTFGRFHFNLKVTYSHLSSVEIFGLLEYFFVRIECTCDLGFFCLGDIAIFWKHSVHVCVCLLSRFRLSQRKIISLSCCTDLKYAYWRAWNEKTFKLPSIGCHDDSVTISTFHFVDLVLVEVRNDFIGILQMRRCPSNIASMNCCGRSISSLFVK